MGGEYGHRRCSRERMLRVIFMTVPYKCANSNIFLIQTHKAAVFKKSECSELVTCIYYL